MTHPGVSDTRPRLIDLFCGAGGAAKGYQRAGFYVIGIDNRPQPNYCGDEFHEADALTFSLTRADAIHASPPCQAHSSIAKQRRVLHPGKYEHPELVAPTRELLEAAGLPYVIENVLSAPLRNPIMLCGSSFALDLRRHRLFECSFPVMGLPCAHHWQTRRFVSLDRRLHRPELLSTIPVHGTGRHVATVVGVHGHHNYPGERELRERAMGIDWMDPYELTQAIPPAYTEHVGHYLMRELTRKVAA